MNQSNSSTLCHYARLFPQRAAKCRRSNTQQTVNNIFYLSVTELLYKSLACEVEILQRKINLVV